jgi:hypothetical protein
MTFWNLCTGLLITAEEIFLFGTSDTCFCIPNPEGLLECRDFYLDTTGGRLSLLSRFIAGVAFVPNMGCIVCRNFNACIFYLSAGPSFCCPIFIPLLMPLLSCSAIFEGMGLCSSEILSLSGDWIANILALIAPLSEELLEEGNFFELVPACYILICSPMV